VSPARELDVTFLMADLSGFTALTEVHGSLHAAEVVGRYLELARGALELGVRLVERIGDELLLVADEPATAVRVALRLREAAEREPLFPVLRAGLNAGRVVERDGAYFGTALNLTARVTAHARAGQILCTERVAAAAQALAGVAVRALGAVRFKHVADPVPVFELVVAGHAEDAVVDPVCRMHVVPDTAPARLPYEGTIYHFCSLECAKAFLERPEAFR
jgi:class 3 adenylate cyclase